MESQAVEAVHKVMDLQKQISTVKARLRKKVWDNSELLKSEIEDLKSKIVES